MLIGGMNSRLANIEMVGSIVKGSIGIPSNNAMMMIALESYFKTQVELALYQDKGIRESLKVEKLKQFILSKQVDVVGLTEVNKDWKRVDIENTVWAATAGWTEARRIQTSHNKALPPQAEFQVGGTLSMCFNELSYQISARGSDDWNLGCWSWMELNGISNHSTLIVTAYCPVVSSSPVSCYSRYLTYLAMNSSLPDTDPLSIPGNITCPCQLFGYDLKHFLEQCISQGQHIIMLMGNFNFEYKDLRAWMLDMGVLDVIGHHHGTDDVPRTHTRSKIFPN